MAAGGGVPWGEGFQAVGLQIRNRFRVAPVDRRWLWRRPEGRAASEAVRQWSDRVRALVQRDKKEDRGSASPDGAAAPKPSSSALRFYKKKVGKEIDGLEDSVIMCSLQALAVPLIGNACHIFMHGLNTVQIYGAEKLQQALQERPKGKLLLTVSNHAAAMDDPFVIASLLPPSVMLEVQKLRWTLCATDRCFTNLVLSTFFRSVKVLPVSRGEGIYQKIGNGCGQPTSCCPVCPYWDAGHNACWKTYPKNRQKGIPTASQQRSIPGAAILPGNLAATPSPCFQTRSGPSHQQPPLTSPTRPRCLARSSDPVAPLDFLLLSNPTPPLLPEPLLTGVELDHLLCL